MEKDGKKKNSHDEKLVTVAIHSYEKAHILKSILESEGIPAVIHGIKMIDPVIPGNVRVRINETDLSEALRIIEKVDFTSQADKELEREIRKEILVPVDFSEYSLAACEFGFRLAQDLDCKVKLLHAFLHLFTRVQYLLATLLPYRQPTKKFTRILKAKRRARCRTWLKK